jgi:thiol-disulfide isomerase/thioredoxin
MKHILLNLLFMSFIISVAAQSQKSANFTIKGTIKGRSDGFIYLSYAAGGEKYKQDSAKISNGTFQFKGTIKEPVMATLMGSLKIRNMDDPNLGSMFIEAKPMKLAVTEGAFKDLVLTGSKTNDEQQQLNKLKAPIRKEMEPVLNAYRNEKDHEKAAAIRDQFEPFNERMDKLDQAFIASHPDSYLSAYLMRFKMSSLNASDAQAIYNKWTNRIKQSNGGKEVAEEIKKLQSGSPGGKATMFAAKDINGALLNLADFKGKKYVLLDFWASWCVPCRKGNPHLLSLYSKYKDQGLEIIGVSDDDGKPEAWKKAVEQDKIGVWKHVLRGLKRTETGYDKSNDISENYGIHTLPTKILIDKDGVIVGRYGGGGENDDAMDKKLAEIFK